MPNEWKTRLNDTLSKLNAQNTLRSHTAQQPDLADLFHVVLSHSPFTTLVIVVKVEDHEGRMRVFASNDYLGLAGHAEIRYFASEAAQMYGMGPRSSALICGYTHLHQQLEQRLAALTRKERALLFPTGYTANLSTIAALAENGEIALYSDARNHASIIDGARLATKNGARLFVYRHNDMEHLESLLCQCPIRHKCIITESLFSMDGDVANLQKLVELKRRYPFLLIVDEAHAILVAGEHGGGFCQELHVQDEVDVVVGTLSKAFGCMGGFVCCSEEMRTFLASRGRGHIFSTSLPTIIVATALHAIDIAQRESWRRKHLLELSSRCAKRLSIVSSTWIIPIILGDAETALQVSHALKKEGFYVPAIRPPTVPEGQCRLRISLSAVHSLHDLDQFTDSLQRLIKLHKKLNDNNRKK